MSCKLGLRHQHTLTIKSRIQWRYHDINLVSIVDICVGDGVGTRLHVSSYTIVVIVIVISEKRE